MNPHRQIVAGELHYPRIPREYWSARLHMAAAMGIDALSTYVFWNVHEEVRGTYRFDGDADLAAFLRCAQEHGLRVLLRPGPYVCAEWDLGGLPAWLLREGAALRTSDPAFMEPVRAWLRRLGEELAPLHEKRGGPIIAVQLENEYGAFGNDTGYLGALRQALHEAGLGDLPLYTIDQPGDVARGALDDVCAAVTFAPGDAGTQFSSLREMRPRQRLLCGEYWAGWFDHWGEPRAQLDDEAQRRDMQWMLDRGVSLNVYMLHGGTNFALWNGANAFAPHPYQPTVTSYDYQAAIDERGAPASKYFAFRDAIARWKGIPLPFVPSVPDCIEVAPFSLNRWFPLHAALGAGIRDRSPLTMEALGASRGYVVYRARTVAPLSGALDVRIADYAIVMAGGRTLATIDRRAPNAAPVVDLAAGTLMEIIVENAGRINYGPQLPFEQKGIIGDVRIGGVALQDWEHWVVGPQLPRLSGASTRAGGAPGFYAGSFSLETPGDTFLDVRGLRKGALWVNGWCLGRYWEIGPQRDLYVPGCRLRPGANEIIALELLELPGSPQLQGGKHRIWSEPQP